MNASFLRSGENGGGETYIRGLLSALSRVDQKNSYLILVSRENRDAFSSLGDNFQIHTSTVASRTPAFRFAYEQIALPYVARRWHADLVFFPANMMSVTLPLWKIRSIVTIHDAVFDHYRRTQPGYAPFLELLVKAGLAKAAARLATRVVTDSEYSRSEIQRTTGIPTNKIAVVPLGVEPIGEPLRCQDAFPRYGITQPYVLTVGRTHKHKNLDRLVRAFAATKRRSNCPHHLVVAGPPGSGHADLQATVARCGLTDCVHLTGYVEESDLPCLYQGAEVFVMPSLYEGFGLPVLEAMGRGTPVILSREGSLPEVGGDAALYFEARDETSMTAVLMDMLFNAELRTQLAEKGRANAARFTWNRTARETLLVFRSAVGQDVAPNFSHSEAGLSP